MSDAQHEAKKIRWLFEAIVENVPAMIFVKSAKELRWELWNKAGEELVGIPRGELQGRTDHEFFPKEQADWFVARDREVLEGRKLVTVEEPIDTRHGRKILLTKKIPIMDDEGQPWFLLGVSLDITERKAHEEEMQRANERLRETLTQLVALQGLAETGQLAGDAAREVLGALDAGDAARARETAGRLAALAETADAGVAPGSVSTDEVCVVEAAVRAAAEGLAEVTAVGAGAGARARCEGAVLTRAVGAVLEELGAHRAKGASVRVSAEPDGVLCVEAAHPAWKPAAAARPSLVRSRTGLALADQLLARRGGCVCVEAGEGGASRVRMLLPAEEPLRE